MSLKVSRFDPASTRAAGYICVIGPPQHHVNTLKGLLPAIHQQFSGGILAIVSHPETRSYLHSIASNPRSLLKEWNEALVQAILEGQDNPAPSRLLILVEGQISAKSAAFSRLCMNARHLHITLIHLLSGDEAMRAPVCRRVCIDHLFISRQEDEDTDKRVWLRYGAGLSTSLADYQSIVSMGVSIAVHSSRVQFMPVPTETPDAFQLPSLRAEYLELIAD